MLNKRSAIISSSWHHQYSRMDYLTHQVGFENINHFGDNSSIDCEKNSLHFQFVYIHYLFCLGATKQLTTRFYSRNNIKDFNSLKTFHAILLSSYLISHHYFSNFAPLLVIFSIATIHFKIKDFSNFTSHELYFKEHRYWQKPSIIDLRRMTH